MAIEEFPPVELADKNGILAAGGDLEVPSLLLAYSQGIFPWPLSRGELLWFAPPERAIIFLDRLHIPQSLEKELKRTNWQFKIDHNFEAVIKGCASSPNRKKQKGTWIIPEMVEAYVKLHEAGYAHSFECYDGDELIGGVYGVSIGLMFAAESMFYLQPNASKLCLVKLTEHLLAHGAEWVDCQVINPFTQRLGAEQVKRDRFTELLGAAIASQKKLF